MGAVVALTKEIDPTFSGVILTFIVPALHGCNLQCPYCFISKRGEANYETVLTPADYDRFVNDIADDRVVSALTIQGHEPLLEGSFAYTKALIRAGKACGAQTALVTNGVRLLQMLDELTDLSPDGITVSLDSADAERHDKLRGRHGAFQAAISALHRATYIESMNNRISIHSVLMPGRAQFLVGMPALLGRLHIKKWSVTPLLQLSGDGKCVPAAPLDRTMRDLETLERAAKTEDIDLIVDDEFNQIHSKAGSIRTPLAFRVLNRPDGVYRLGPDGSCAIGHSIIERRNAVAEPWRPVDDAAAYLRRLADTGEHANARMSLGVG